MGKNYLNGKYSFDFTSLKKFYQKRIARIAPLYYFVVLCLSILVYQSLWTGHNWYKIFGLLTFTFDLDAQPYFTGSLWSLSVEMQFYLIAPLLILIVFQVCKNLRQTLGIIFISFAVSLGFTFLYSKNLISGRNQVRHFLIHFFCFPIGISLNLLFKYFDEHFAKAKNFIFKYSNLGFGLNLGLIYLFLNLNIFIINLNIRAFSFVYLCAFTVISTFLCIAAIYLAESNCKQNYSINWTNLLRNPLSFLEILGMISYSFYLWHGDLLTFFKNILDINTFTNYFLALALGFGSTFGLSVLSYYLIEKKLICYYLNSFLKFFSSSR